MGHIDANTVLDFLEGRLSKEERDRADAHVDVCSECRVLLSELADSRDSQNPATGGPEPEDDEGPRAPMTIGERLGRYVVLDWLGAGGMGVVYGAYDPELERKVALKVWRPDSSERALPRELSARLLREARALAQVSHPNVVAVFDVGAVGEELFIAMEFVDGRTLLEWRRDEPRGWREIVATYAEAGRGLAAAHAANVIHRDFKAENVLVGPGARVRVTDFGLARPAAGAAKAEEAPASEGQATTLSPATLSTRGNVAGTPAYMAPEQREGVATAKSDQFSFGVALYEALYGQRPFASGDRGSIDEAPKTSEAPAWVRAVLLRSLRVSPDERYPSMDDMLAALARDPSKTRTRWAAGALAVLFVAVVAGLGVAGRLRPAKREELCSGADQQLASVWDESRKRALHEAFLKTELPYAEASWQETARAIDAYAHEWTLTHTDTCRATRVRGEQSEAVLDLRMECMNARLASLRALLDVFARGERSVVDGAVQASYSLAPIAGCSNVSELTETIKPPADPAARAKVALLDDVWVRAKALERAGRYKESLESVVKLTADARALSHAPLEARALVLKGILESHVGDSKASAADLEEAVSAGERAHDDRTKAEALVSLVYVLGVDEAKFTDSERTGRHAQAALDRLGGDLVLQARLEANLAAACTEHSDHDAAGKHAELALSLYRKVYGDSHFMVAQGLLILGYQRAESGHEEEAFVLFEQALTMFESSVGGEHPRAAMLATMLAGTLHLLGRYEEGLTMATRAARTFERASAAPTQLAYAQSYIGLNEDGLGRYAEARDELRKAHALLLKSLGEQNPRFATACNDLARALRHLGEGREALALDLRAEKIMTEAHAPDDGLMAASLVSLGESRLALGSAALAVPSLERAVRIDEHVSASPVGLARARLYLAVALAKTKPDDARIAPLAEAALAFYARRPGDAPEHRLAAQIADGARALKK